MRRHVDQISKTNLNLLEILSIPNLSKMKLVCLLWEEIVARENIKRHRDLTYIRSTEGGGRTQSAASKRAAGSDLYCPLFPFCGWRHWGDKVVDDWEAVGRGAMGGLWSGQTAAGLHLGDSSSQII